LQIGHWVCEGYFQDTSEEFYDIMNENIKDFETWMIEFVLCGIQTNTCVTMRFQIVIWDLDVIGDRYVRIRVHCGSNCTLLDGKRAVYR
jgi:hypothetical protein